MTLPKLGEGPPAAALLEMAAGYWVSQALYVVAKLGIADLLKEGPKSCEELARLTGADGRSLYRVMRGLASVGVFAESEGGRFALTPLAAPLQTAPPDSIRAMVIMLGEEAYRAWGDLLMSVKTGEPAFERVFQMGRFEYLAQNPEAGAVFNEAMTVFARRMHLSVVKAYDFSGFRTVVDVGGGHGGLLTLILRTHPKVRGLLFDSPSVVEGAKKRLETAGVAARCEAVAGDFFQTVPSGGGAYILSHVIHDWDDERSVAILRNCRQAMRKDGKLLLVEEVLPPGNASSFAKLLDLHMLVVTGGRERTEAEYAALFAAAGFRLTKVIPTDSGASVIEGVPAGAL